MNFIHQLTFLIIILVIGNTEVIQLDQGGYFTKQISLHGLLHPQNFTIKAKSIPIDSNLFIVGTPIFNSLYHRPNLRVESAGKVWQCDSKDQAGLCIISSELLSIQKLITLSVSSVVSNTIVLQLYFGMDFKMNLGEVYQPNLGNSHPYDFMAIMRIPKDVNFTELTVSAIVKNPDQIQGSFQIYANNINSTNQIPSQSKHSWKGVSVWNDGKAITFKNPEHVKPGDTLRFLMEFPGNVRLSLQSFLLSDNIRNINVLSSVKEILAAKSRRIYSLDISEFISHSFNASLIITMTKYSGQPTVDISPDKYFQNKSQIVEIFSEMSTSSFIITAQKRRSAGIDRIVYIRVKSNNDCAFQFTTKMNIDGFFIIKDGEMHVSSIEGVDVDNILYYYDVDVVEGNAPTPTTFDLRINGNPNSINFNVTRCKSLERNTDLTCIHSTIDEYNEAKNNLHLIVGHYHQSFGSHYYSFVEDPSDCQKNKRGNLYHYKCIFQVLLWIKNEEDRASKNNIQYQLSLSQSDSTTILQQGFNHRGNVQASSLKRFSFRLGSLKNIQQIRFHLTTFSGSCMMLISTRLLYNFKDFEIVTKEVATFTQNFSNEYFVVIRGIELSHFSIIAVVVRDSEPGQTVITDVVTLAEAIAQTFTIKPEKQMNFLIYLPNRTQFTLSLQSVQGLCHYTIFPIQNNVPAYTKVISSSESRMTIYPDMIPYSTSNSFVVSVKALSQSTTISIAYYLPQTSCLLFPMNKPISRSGGIKSGDCLSFHLTKFEDLQIVITTHKFAYTVTKMDIRYVVNGTENKIKSRFTIISKNELRDMCPMMDKKGEDMERCNLNLKIQQIPHDQTIKIAVQYTSSDIVLFDGMVQRVRCKLSPSVGRHFYYTLNRQNTATVFVRSKTPTHYKMLGRIVDFANYSKGYETYPRASQQNEELVLSSSTTQSGQTALVISSLAIFNNKCEECILLITIYAKGPQHQVDFKIEVSQATVIVEQGETRQGYVEKDTSIKYEIRSKEGQQTVVTLNSLHQDCSKIQAFSRQTSSFETTKIHNSSDKNYFILDKPQVPTIYAVYVTGISSCAYQISFTSSRQKLYELQEGIPIDLFLQKKQYAYLLYYHSKPESFRLLSMADHGDSILEGEPLNISQITYLDTLVNNVENHFSFREGKQIGFLQIDQRNEAFCSECYYLFRVKAQTNLSTSVLLHSEGSSVPLRQGKFIRQSLESGDFQQYVFYSSAKFNVSINILFGTANVTITKSGKTIVKPQIINSSSVIPVINRMPKQDFVDGYDPDSQFSIKVESASDSLLGFVISVAANKKPVVLRKGVPINVRLDTEQCIIFPSYTQETNLSIMMDSEHMIQSVEYNLTFTEQGQEGAEQQLVEVQSEKGQYNVLLKLDSKQGYYTLCLDKNKYATWVSILLLGSNVPTHVTLNSEIMVMTQEDQLHIFEIYTPIKGWLMFEGFECRGEVNIIGSQDYQSVAARKPEIKFTHTKTAGHYVGKAQVDPGLYFMAVEPRGSHSKTKQPNLAIVKYSMFESHNFPYDKFEIEDEGLIRYKYNRTTETMSFIVKKVTQQGSEFNILNHYYRVYISDDSLALHEAAQCHTTEVLNKTVGFGAILEDTPDDVIITFTQQQLGEFSEQNSTLYVSVVCYIEVVPPRKHYSNIFRFNYDQIQMTVRYEVEMTTLWKIAVFIGLPSLVGLFVLFLALRFCVRRIYMADTKLVEEEVKDANPVGQTEGNIMTIPSTANVLVPGEVGMYSVSEKNIETGMMSIGQSNPNSGCATPAVQEPADKS